MASRNLDGFDAWLRARKPLFDTELFVAAGLAPPSFLPPKAPPRPPSSAGSRSAQSAGGSEPKAAPPGGPGSTLPKTSAKATPSKSQPAPVGGGAPSKRESDDIPLGHRYDRGDIGPAVSLPTDLLPRHVAILAGSGSGKTVLLRRIVEEAALLGIPAIVLDTNNDLARLGDAWPTAPDDWTPEDVAKAANYRKRVEVLIWTPGRNAGRPMSLALLPDFAALGDDEDERAQAIEMARATLSPYIGATGASAMLKEGVLADALRRFAREGGNRLEQFIDQLSDLPDNVSHIDDAPKLASAMANRLRAAIATNPLLQSRGAALDPHVLLESDSDKTRISVVNFSGLANDEARQTFVNQLQMALFTWIKRNPSPTGRLYVLDEAQNFAPSQRRRRARRARNHWPPRPVNMGSG
jgi:DNA helicase HerA-like ATPase